MPSNSTVPDYNDVTAPPIEKDLYLQLIQQFYDSSVEQYGIESDQSRTFALHLTAHASHD